MSYCENCAEHKREIDDLKAKLAYFEARLSDEIKWGHRECTSDNCKSSGIDCPKAKEINQ